MELIKNRNEAEWRQTAYRTGVVIKTDIPWARLDNNTCQYPLIRSTLLNLINMLIHWWRGEGVWFCDQTDFSQTSDFFILSTLKHEKKPNWMLMTHNQCPSIYAYGDIRIYEVKLLFDQQEYHQTHKDISSQIQPLQPHLGSQEIKQMIRVERVTHTKLLHVI